MRLKGLMDLLTQSLPASFKVKLQTTQMQPYFEPTDMSQTKVVSHNWFWSVLKHRNPCRVMYSVIGHEASGWLNIEACGKHFCKRIQYHIDLHERSPATEQTVMSPAFGLAAATRGFRTPHCEDDLQRRPYKWDSALHLVWMWNGGKL